MKRESLIRVATQMNSSLSAMSLTRKVTIWIIPFIGTVQNKQTHRDRKQTGGGQGWWQRLHRGDKATAPGDCDVLQPDSGVCECT